MPVLSPRHVAITATASFAACAVALWTQPVRKEGANTETDSSCNSSAEENEDSWAESHAKDNEQDHRRDAVGRVLLHDGLARMQPGGSVRGGGKLPTLGSRLILDIDRFVCLGRSSRRSLCKVHLKDLEISMLARVFREEILQ